MWDKQKVQRKYIRSEFHGFNEILEKITSEWHTWGRGETDLIGTYPIQ